MVVMDGQAKRDMIMKLTPGQEAMLPQFRSEWFRVGTCTDRADRAKAEAAILAMRAEIGVATKPIFVWCESPATSLLALHVLKSEQWKAFAREFSRKLPQGLRASLWDSLWDSLRDSLGDSLRDSLRASLWASLRDSLGASLRDSLGASLRDSLRASLWASLRDSLGDSLRDSLRASLWASLRDSLGASLRDSLGASLRDSLGASLRDSIWASLRDSLWASLRDSLWASLRDSLGASLRDSLGASLRDSIWASLRDSLGASLRDSLGDSLGDSLRASLRDSLWASLGEEWWGQHEAYWIAFYLFCRDIVGIKYGDDRSRQLDMWRDIAQSCCWWWCHENYVVISERPTACRITEAEGRLHCEGGPALAFADGYALWRWHGVTVPEDVIAHPEQLTIARIDAENNAEVRRVMLERYGEARYLEDSGAKPIHSDKFGVLFRKEISVDEPLVMVRVVNSTAEPDGHFKVYWLRVPPTIETAQEAVAWSFGVEPKDYKPAIET
jgi:hypothetical protein